MKKTIVIVFVFLLVLSLFGCKSKELQSDEIRFSNLKSQDAIDKVIEIMTSADISLERQKVFLTHIDQFNSIINSNTKLASNFENYNPNAAKYDPYELQDQWNTASPDFMGYNCRITAFGLFRDFLSIDTSSEIRDDIIMMDLVALEEDPSVLVGKNDKKAFSVFYSTVPTTLTKDTHTHVENLQKDWKNRGIAFLPNERASLISVVMHDSFSEDDNYLFIGHIGVLFDFENKLYFVEKMAFQEPYQVTEFTTRSQLSDYLMAKYDVSYGQPTASPFIMENDMLMEGYRNKYDSTHDDNKYIDAVSYDMDLFLDTEENTLTEKVSIEIENNTDAPVSELCIRDMTPAILKHCEEFYSEDNKNLKSQILSIILEESSEKLDYEFGKDASVIFVALSEDKTIDPGEIVTVTVNMKTDIPNRGDRFGYRETEKGTLYALSFCYPYLADNENGEWNTSPFFDDGENRSSDLADYTVEFHAPEDYVIAMSGSEQTEKGTTTVEIKDFRDFAVVACNFMEKEAFDADGIVVNSYYLDGKNTEEYRVITKAAATDSIEIFNAKVGQYPYKELDIVPCLFGFGYGGMEYPGFVMVNASGFFDAPFYDALSHEEKIAHEIAHQWFYGIVGNNEYREAWIDEGLATVLEKDIYGLTPCNAHDIVSGIEDGYPSLEEKEQIRKELIEYAREGYKDVYLNVSPDEFTKDRFYGDAEYNGSYCFFQEIRLVIGDNAFADLIKNLYETYYMKSVNTEDVLTFIKTYDNSEKTNEIISFYFK